MSVRLSHTAAILLQAVARGKRYGFALIECTGFPSGTVYPALRRLERDRLISSEWEDERLAELELRPARKYYSLTPEGRDAIAESKKRYPLLAFVAADSAKEEE